MSGSTLRVVCLCAEWCGTCQEWRGPFEREAAAHADVRFEWIDIEDEADLVGDVDVETFPTLLIGDAAGVRFFGPVLPRTEALASLLRSLRAGPPAVTQPDDDVAALWARVRVR